MGANSIAFSPDGTILASVGNDGMGRLWKTATGELQTAFDGQSAAWRSVGFSSDGLSVAATGIGDNDIRLWRVKEEPRNANCLATIGTETKTGTEMPPRVL